jgi:signal transduction histidine kinase/CheY-like chemotaxis protein
MSATTIRPTENLTDIRSTRLELRRETIWFILPVVLLASFLLVYSARSMADPFHGAVLGLLLFFLPVVVWALHSFHYLMAAWTLIAGCAAVIFLLTLWAQIPAAIVLLALPAGFAALFVSTPGGVLAASLCTVLLLAVPDIAHVVNPSLRIITLIQVWSTVWLIWLTSRPLLTAMQWFYTSHHQSRNLLEQARDRQTLLGQTLEDLAEANLQLTRLNRLAQSMRQLAEEARRTKEEFVANVSHELRTPLNMIIGFVEMIMQAPETYGPNVPQALLADLAVVLRSSRHLSSLIDDVLDLSQIETGQMALTKDRVALDELIQAAEEAVYPLFESKGLYLHTESPPDLPPVHCDRTRIRQVLLNLLSNAGRFVERGGVQIRAWQETNAVVVSVADTGPGIAAADLDKVFQPFQQVDSSIRRRHGGSGLGLSISKGFVELHEGKMWVENAQGQGTTFYFRLPISAPPLTSGSAGRWLSPYATPRERTGPSLAPVPIDRPRLVVLEPGQSLQKLLARYLHNVEIVGTTSLEEASRELSRVPAQALLVNTLAVGDSLHELEQATSLPYATPVLVCSVPGTQESAGMLGVADYLVKPVSRDALLAALQRLPGKNKTLLLIDNDPDTLRLFHRMLSSPDQDHRIIRASDGKQAIEILRRQRTDAVLLDLIMPEMDGFQFLAEKGRDPATRDIPVIVLSALDPAGQPIVSKSLAITRGGGISVRRLLGSIAALIEVLSPQQVHLGV